MPPQPCLEMLRSGVCLRQGCPLNHDVEHCGPCGRNIPVSQMLEHVQGRTHRARVTANGTRTPTVSQSPRPPQPPPRATPSAPPLAPVPDRARARPNATIQSPRPPAHQRTVSGISICSICNLHVRTEELEPHIRQHARPAPAPASGSSGISRARAATPATPNDEPVPLGKRVCEDCRQLVWKSRWAKHLRSEGHRRNVEGHTSPDLDIAQGDGDGGVEDYIQVSHIDGRDFGTVERDTVTGEFPTVTLTFSVTKRRPQASFSLRRVDVVPVDDQNPAATITQGFTAIIEGRPPVLIDRVVTVRASFQPQYESRFEDTLNFVFLDHHAQSEIVISRALRGIAGSADDHENLRPRYPHVPPHRPPPEPPRVFIPLTPPTWTRNRWESYLEEFPLPQDIVDAIPAEHYEHAAERIARNLVPRSFNLQSYENFFHSLLYIEEGALQHELSRTRIPEVMVESEFPRYKIRLTDERENELPEVKIGDYVLLDDIASDLQYEGRIHKMESKFRGHYTELAVTLRMADEFNVYHNNLFNVRFKLNRMTLRRMHSAVSSPYKPECTRLLFPSREDARLPVVPADFEFEPYNPRILDDAQQRQAVESIVHQPRESAPFIIFGPPGTGKTVTAVEAILQVLKYNPEWKVLACAPSNTAADLLAIRLSSHLSEDEMFRLNAISRPLDECPGALLPYCNINDHDVFAFLPREELRQFRVVVSTCSSAGVVSSLNLTRGHFSHVFIDEAGQAEEPLAMIPILGAVGPETRVVLAGDTNQLGPIIKCHTAARHGLKHSYLARLQAIDEVYNLGENRGRTIVKLIQNRRSHGSIIAFSNRYYYEDELRATARQEVTNSLFGSPVLQNPQFPVVFHGIYGKNQRSGRSQSYFNVGEASLVKVYCIRLVNDPLRHVEPAEIGVITPYRAQVKRIKTLLFSAGFGLEAVMVGSVEQFQGQERRIIIFSTVRSNMATSQQASMGFLVDRRRLNVALTRPKALLVVIGDPCVLGMDLLWRAFLNFVHSRGGCTGKPFNWNPQEQMLPPGYEEVEDQGRALIEGEEFVNGIRSSIFKWRES